MRRLMLLRHAKTETDAPTGRDQDRRLDERGHQDAAMIGDFIASHPPVPELVLVSTAVRAQQTWDLALAAMKDRVPAPQVESVPELYGAEPMQILYHIRLAAAHDPKQLLLVGHNPGMHELALALTGEGDSEARHELMRNMPTAGLAVLDFDTDDWGDVSFARGNLLRFITPKLLKHGSVD
ncbi:MULTISPECIES: histidine phosphatase family protein [unclassified Bradyrhizobium]|uniref:SixA phosphatase family protein n=1 Tax=unclassified Bradyrhizobium TaxID=2631580 RepID=UPI0028ED6DC9|nr:MULTISPECIES: histidine phosphatase family protein [unclassified Bradyrhizobium]